MREERERNEREEIKIREWREKLNIERGEMRERRN